ncbi:lysophospholipid acyltransferase family protein [Campylobacter sp. RM12637]|uniref:lysophospholipid acyltransferase family protein n=1 Tax=Campylobacter sp. RM12637 TaxID=2735734 RepID=UPI003014C966|nr:lysophospholipid acyltransferase family protein [Campylobacter sp. RM12637]
MAKYKVKILAFIIFILLNIIYLTCKKRFYGEKTLPKEPCIVLFWHGKLTMMAFIFAYMKKNGYKKKPYVLISNHKDGELIASVMKYFNINAVRGSTYDFPVKALLEIKSLLGQGHDVYITPDGPRGPYHSISAGSYKIALKYKIPTIIFDNAASRFYRAKSWDKMILAKPFSTIAYIISKPILLDEENSVNLINKEFNKLELKLNEEGFYV